MYAGAACSPGSSTLSALSPRRRVQVPLLGMSRVTQRIVDVWKRRALAAEAELAAERVGKRPTEAAGAAKAKVAKDQAAAVATGRGATIEA